MKRLLLTCCIIATTFGLATAQSSTPPTKAGFQAKVTQMDNYLTANNPEQAKIIFMQLKAMMEQELGVNKQNIVSSTTQAAKDQYLAVINHERELYSALLQLSQNMATNKTQMDSKLAEFANTF